jgi:hypothetical protein
MIVSLRTTLMAMATLLVAACGSAATRGGPHAARTTPASTSGVVSGEATGAPDAPPGASPGPSGLPNIQPYGAATGSTTYGTPLKGSGASATPSGNAVAPSHQPNPPPAPPGSGGTCPDPRYCADYSLLPNDASWPKDSGGRTSIHYRINPSHAGTPTQLSDAQIIAAVQQLARTWEAAAPSVTFVYDGQTSDQPVNFNNVVGFTAAAGNAAVNIPMTFSSDGKTITGFNIQFAPQIGWTWQPCDGASVPCDPYPGTGLDLGAASAHAWGHVIGLGELAGSRDVLLTNAGSIATGPDCGSTAGPVCRFAVTLGLGDIRGARFLYPGSQSAPMPTIYYDQ